MVPVLGLLLYSFYAKAKRLEWAVKPVASALFLVAAVRSGAFASAYGVAVFVSLVFAAAGDVLLVSRAQAPFRLGIFAFLLGHLLFLLAFLIRGVDWSWALAVSLVAAVPSWLVLRWVSPTLPAGLRTPVAVYLVVVTLMLGFAFGTWAARGDALLPLGALMFYASDFAVARDRFVKPGFINRAWGVPMYYFGQLLLASTVAVEP
jgi:uncharacterized membrane protein YhhN